MHLLNFPAIQLHMLTFCAAKAKAVITANQAVIGNKVLNLKEKVDDAVPGTEVKVVFVATRVPGVTVAGRPWDVPLEAVLK